MHHNLCLSGKKRDGLESRILEVGFNGIVDIIVGGEAKMMKDK
jgi:hypothetical protein